MDKVVFRKFEDRNIIAIFPRIPGTSDPYTCESYMHIGQHGSCDPYYLVYITKLATPEEYAPLLEELRSIGYELDIKKRITKFDLEFRKQSIKE